MPNRKERQYRAMANVTAPQTESGEEYRVTGYATTFERYPFYEDEDGTVYEKFSQESFSDCDMSDVIFQFDHRGMVFARQSNGTLTLDVDEHGLKIDADLSKTTDARSMYEAIATGNVTKMSWGFAVAKPPYYDKETRTIIWGSGSIKKIYDVSAVSIPANDETNINACAFIDGVIDKSLTERSEAQERLMALRKKILKNQIMEEINR
ncbi:phage prohead protease, HK97 family [Pseudoramibacter alactolyticus ATCC 23263]|uniref:Phage prohead protease, HK97 family n=1 Tax=Pseudoramibacter alactolyticus ATCC 23263 TaxID=887929 RepID=E6MGY2_9FIRM|nr:HK97 family phage prohead protease [Pseudoramibacter alactolyticus]EFV01872.1 phage prohead protease, HK97 family [Pseudoramibacter alactolyticus ATCC 23263]